MPHVEGPDSHYIATLPRHTRTASVPGPGDERPIIALSHSGSRVLPGCWGEHYGAHHYTLLPPPHTKYLCRFLRSPPVLLSICFYGRATWGLMSEPKTILLSAESRNGLWPFIHNTPTISWLISFYITLNWWMEVLHPTSAKSKLNLNRERRGRDEKSSYSLYCHK